MEVTAGKPGGAATRATDGANVEPEVRSGFARAEDGVSLYWRAIGQGPAIVCNNGVGVSLFFWKYLAEHFKGQFTVLLWDYRGHGRSDRRLDPLTADLSIRRHALDLAIVLTAAGVTEPAVLVGHSMGCQVVLEAIRLYPQRARAAVLMLGTAGKALHTFYDWSGSAAMFRGLHRVVHAIGPRINNLVRPLLESPLAFPTATALDWVDRHYTREEDLASYSAHLSTLDLRLFLTAVLATDAHDAWDVLPGIGVPVLIIAAERDLFTPMWCSRKIARLIPGAELFELADATHAALVEQPETIHHRMDRFFRERLRAI